MGRLHDALVCMVVVSIMAVVMARHITIPSWWVNAAAFITVLLSRLATRLPSSTPSEAIGEFDRCFLLLGVEQAGLMPAESEGIEVQKFPKYAGCSQPCVQQTFFPTPFRACTPELKLHFQFFFKCFGNVSGLFLQIKSNDKVSRGKREFALSRNSSGYVLNQKIYSAHSITPTWLPSC